MYDLQHATYRPAYPCLTACQSLSDAKEVKVHPHGSDGTENASLYLVGTATTILLVGLIPLN